jgi:Na+ dependent nucleoside transporter N-terminus
MTKHQTSHPSPERRSQPFGRREWTVISVAIMVAAGAALLARGGVVRAQPFVGLAVILAIAYVWSANRRAIEVRTVAWGLGLQIVFALIVLRTETGRAVFGALGHAVTRWSSVRSAARRRGPVS